MDLSTRVQFPPVTPTMRASFNGENTSVLTKKCRFDSGRMFQCFVSVAQLDESAGFRSPRPLVRFQPLTPSFRGLGKRINPLGLGPRESRFKSEVPDQFLWGSQVVRRLAVTQFIAGSNPAPTAKIPGSLSGREPLSYKEVQ